MMDYYAKQCLKLCNHRPTSSYCLRQHISSLLNKQKAHRPKKRRLKLANLRQREENRENDFHNNKRRHERRDIDFNDFFIRQNHDSTHKNGQKPVPPYHDCKYSCNRQQRSFLLSELTITSVSFLSLTFFSSEASLIVIFRHTLLFTLNCTVIAVLLFLIQTISALAVHNPTSVNTEQVENAPVQHFSSSIRATPRRCR
jgi:hypothetical protein